MNATKAHLILSAYATKGRHAVSSYALLLEAHINRPALADVLESLALDASCYENARDFADFAADMGYDTDSRKAEKTYRACGRIAARLRDLLGPDNYATLATLEG